MADVNFQCIISLRITEKEHNVDVNICFHGHGIQTWHIKCARHCLFSERLPLRNVFAITSTQNNDMCFMLVSAVVQLCYLVFFFIELRCGSK